VMRSRTVAGPAQSPAPDDLCPEDEPPLAALTPNNTRKVLALWKCTCLVFAMNGGELSYVLRQPLFLSSTIFSRILSYGTHDWPIQCYHHRLF
jgi:hypothetical protein